MAVKTGLRPDQAVGETLATAAHAVLQDARSAIDDVSRSDAAAVHDFRKAMKQWRALLRLIEPVVGADARRLRDAARDLARELATARDGQAALDALADLGKAGQSASAPALSPRSIASIEAKLADRRQSAEQVALTGAMREKLRAALEMAGRAVDHWPLPEARFWQAASGLTEGYARVRQKVPANWATASDEELHELRQRIVVHRYQMPLAEPLWPRFTKLWTGEAQRLRERLGARQDLAVLEAMTAPHAPLAPWRSRLMPLIAARKADHAAAAARLCARLFAERPKAFHRRLDALWDGAKAGGAEAD